MILSVIAAASALPAPGPLPKEAKVSASEKVDDLSDGDGEKDLKGSESIGYGYYGYPLGYYPYSYYSSHYQAYPYYAYRGFGGLSGSYWW